jgi:hypothetical protein
MDITDRVLADLQSECDWIGIEESDILEYSRELSYAFPGVSFEWAHTQIQNNLNGWVKSGLVAYQVKYRKLWQQAADKYTDFADYCKRGLGRSVWYIDRLIDAAKVVSYLAERGFKVLPSCEAQARPLVKMFKDGSNDVFDCWREVVGQLSAEKITADRVAAIVNPESAEKQLSKKISKATTERAAQVAAEQGLDINELINHLLDSYQDEGDDSESIDDEDRDDESEASASEFVTIENSIVVDNLDRMFRLAERCRKAARRQLDPIFDRVGDFYGGTGGVRMTS